MPFLVFLIKFLIFNSLLAQNLPLGDLYRYGGALNIEGGRIAQEQLHADQIWADLAFVLDCPFSQLEGQVNHYQLSKNNNFSLKEANLYSYDEEAVHALLFSYLLFYVENARDFVWRKSAEEEIVIVYHLHRGRSGKYYYQHILKPLMEAFLLPKDKGLLAMSPGTSHDEKNGLFMTYNTLRKNVLVKFRYGFQDLAGYEDADIVLSAGLVASTSPELVSGDAVISDTFVPFDLNRMELDLDGKYRVTNHLLQNAHYEKLADFITPEIIDFIKRELRSENPLKASFLSFPFIFQPKSPVVVQSNGMFNPQLLPSSFKVKSNKIELPGALSFYNKGYMDGIKIYGIGIKDDPVPGQKTGKGRPDSISFYWLLGMGKFISSNSEQLAPDLQGEVSGASLFLTYMNQAYYFLLQSVSKGLLTAEGKNNFLRSSWFIMLAMYHDSFPYLKYSPHEIANMHKNYVEHFFARCEESVLCPLRMDLMPFYALERLSLHLELCLIKFVNEEPWEKRGFSISSRMASLYRHLHQALSGQGDEDHLAHLLWNYMAIYHVLHSHPYLYDL